MLLKAAAAASVLEADEAASTQKRVSQLVVAWLGRPGGVR